MKFNLKIIRRLNILVSGGISGVYFYNNAFCLKDNKSKLEFKINDTPAPIPTNLKLLVRDVMSDMGLSSEERSLIKIFMTDDCNLKHLGYLDKNFGVYLGIPQHFLIDKSSDFMVERLVGNTKASLESLEPWSLKHTLSLSKEAKQFAVANQLFEAQDKSFYYLGLLPLFVFLQGNIISILSEKLFKALGRSLPLFHAFIFLSATWLYVLLNDIISIHRQEIAGLHAAGLGLSYIEGGIEYYEKVLERNKMLKKLEKSAPYDENGELEKFMGFRTVSMPFERRLRYLKDLRRNYKVSDKPNPVLPLELH